MSPLHASRRRFLHMTGALALAPSLTAARTAPARGDLVGRVLAISDMHSAYERTSQLLAAFEAEVKSRDVPHVIAINGDIFEHGNVVSVRSQGAIDWAFLAALPGIAPTVVNLGNHDNDLTTDLAEVVARMRSLGIQVVTTIADIRTQAGYAQPVATLPFGHRTLRVVGIATDSVNTYPQATRHLLSIPSPDDWVKANLAGLLQGADLTMVMSHAGVVPDREILPLLPDGALMIGGHNHLLFQHQGEHIAYAHTGSWTNAYTVAEFHSDGAPTAASRTVALDAPTSAPLTDLIDATLAQHMTETDRTVLGQGQRALSLGDTGRQVAQGMAVAAQADAGFIGHTTLGTGLQAGPVTRYAFHAIVRFDGKLMVAEVSRQQFDAIMARANQDRPVALADRSGDFLYGSGAPNPGKATVAIATTDWCARNQAEYFGTTDLAFREVPSAGIKAISVGALLDS